MRFASVLYALSVVGCKGRPHACVHTAYLFARNCAHDLKCDVQNLRFHPYTFVLRMRATYCVQHILRARYFACKVFAHCICALYLRTASRRVGTKPSPSAGCVYGCMFAQLCTQPFHNNFNFYLLQDIYYSPVANWKYT